MKEIYGIQYGYRGFYMYEWIELTPEFVESIHNQGFNRIYISIGGTILGSSRGGFKGKEMVDVIEKKKIN